MENKLDDLETRLAYQEELGRMTVDCLDMAAAFGDFQRNICCLDTPERIIEEALSRLGKLAEFEAAGVFFKNEQSGDFLLAYSDTPELDKEIEQDLELLIETGMMAQALRERRPLLVSSHDYKRMMLAHSLGTASRTRGFFLGYLRPGGENIPDAWLRLISIILQHCAGALESLELSRLTREHNQELAIKVEEKTAELTRSLEELRREVTERMRAERVLHEITANIPGVVFQFCADVSGKRELIFVSDGILWLHGYAPQRIKENPRLILSAILPEDIALFKDSILRAIQSGGDWACEYRVLTAKGELRWVRGSAAARREGDNLFYNGVLTDTTELRQAKEELEHLALHDPLTGLPNRTLFLDRLDFTLATARRHGQKIALLYIDLDHFKQINDAFGHQVGDEVLKIASARMKAHLRESDTVARVGGDEFVVILPGVDSRDDAELVAAKLAEEFCRPIFVEGNQCVCGASVGLSLFPEDGNEVDALIRKADENMYRPK